MAGYEMVVLPPTTYDFSFLQTTTPSFCFVPVAQRIDISRYELVSVGVRWHSNGISGANNQVDIYCIPDGFTPDDPSLNWNFQGSGTLLATMVNTTSTPSYVTTTISSSTNPGPGLVGILLKGSRTLNGASGNLIAKVSIDLLCKSGSGNGGFRPGAYMGYGGRGL